MECRVSEIDDRRSRWSRRAGGGAGGGNYLDSLWSASGCNLGVKWVFHEMPTAAIVFSWQRLSGYALLDLIQATSSQHHRQRQLPFKGDRYSSAEWTRHARAKPGEPAELWYRGSLGGTECTCPRARRSQREAAAARCHSRVHCVWGPEKVRCTHLRVGSDA